MLLSESCHSSQSRQLETIHLTLKYLTQKENLTLCKTLESKSCSMSQELRTECLTQKKGQCFRLGGKSNCNLHTKKTPYSQRHASKPCWIKVESWGLEPFAQFLAATRLNGNNFSWRGEARRGAARHGKARRGKARRGMANTLHLFGGAEVCSTRLGEAWQGAAGQGMARRGLANTLHLFGGAEVCLGAARRGQARRGVARRGAAWRGMANTRHLTGCRSLPMQKITKHKKPISKNAP